MVIVAGSCCTCLVVMIWSGQIFENYTSKYQIPGFWMICIAKRAHHLEVGGEGAGAPSSYTTGLGSAKLLWCMDYTSFDKEVGIHCNVLQDLNYKSISFKNAMY